MSKHIISSSAWETTKRDGSLFHLAAPVWIQSEFTFKHCTRRLLIARQRCVRALCSLLLQIGSSRELFFRVRFDCDEQEVCDVPPVEGTPLVLLVCVCPQIWREMNPLRLESVLVSSPLWLNSGTDAGFFFFFFDIYCSLTVEFILLLNENSGDTWWDTWKRLFF